MATKVYESATVTLLDGTEVYLTPLKIKYLREFMVMFEFVKTSQNDDQAMLFLTECAAIAMKQFCPDIKSRAELEEVANMPIIYKILDIAGGIKLDKKSAAPVKDQAEESGSSWEDLDLAKLEAEVFLLGIWKDYEELESSMSMSEIVTTLGAKRDLDYVEKKFLAGIQGIDLDKQTGRDSDNAWERMKAKVFSGGATTDPNDITAFQGTNAIKAGFGIDMGLSYEKIDRV